MLPTKSQYKRWTLPAKYSFWGVVLAMIALIPMAIALRDWVMAVPDYAVIAFNYGTSEMTIYGAAGDTPETAVIIRGANSHEAGIKAEHYWIRRRYPGYEKAFQAVFEIPKPVAGLRRTIIKDADTGAEVEAVRVTPLPPRRYDLVTIRSWYGRTREVYFDITAFWGKPSEPRPGGLTEDEALRRTMKRLEDAINRKKDENIAPATPK